MVRIGLLVTLLAVFSHAELQRSTVHDELFVGEAVFLLADAEDSLPTEPFCENLEESLGASTCVNLAEEGLGVGFHLNAPGGGGYLHYNGLTFDDDHRTAGSNSAINVCLLALYGDEPNLDDILRVPTFDSHYFAGGPHALHWYGRCDELSCDNCTNNTPFIDGSYNWTSISVGDACSGELPDDLDSATTSLTCYFDPLPAQTPSPIECNNVFGVTGSNMTVVDNVLTRIRLSPTGWNTAYGSQVYTAGTARWDISINLAVPTDNLWEMIVGVASDTTNAESFLSSGDTGFGYILGTGGKTEFGESQIYGPEYSGGDMVTVELDIDALELRFSLNGIDLGVSHDASDLSLSTSTSNLTEWRLAVSFYSRAQVAVTSCSDPPPASPSPTAVPTPLPRYTCGDLVHGSNVGLPNVVLNAAGDFILEFFHPPHHSGYTLSTCNNGTNYDTWLLTFSDPSLEVQTGSNDDTPVSCAISLPTTSLIVSPQSTGSTGELIYVVVEGFAANEGDFVLSIDCDPLSTFAPSVEPSSAPTSTPTSLSTEFPAPTPTVEPTPIPTNNTSFDPREFYPPCKTGTDCLSGVCLTNGPTVNEQPDYFYCDEPFSCDPSAPPRYDGMCNNLVEGRQLRGSRGHGQLRRIDGTFVNEFLPAERNVSDTIADSAGKDIPNNFGTSALLVFMGQFIDHDITIVHANSSNQRVIEGSGIVTDITFSRSERVGDNPPFLQNDLSAWLDLSMVYGSDERTGFHLRSLEGGRMQTQIIDGEEYLPYNDQLVEPVEVDVLMGNIEGAFVAGDVRVNENMMLTALHTLFVREHNRLCRYFAARQPELNDEELYNMARKWNTAQYQNIVLGEWFEEWHRTPLPQYNGYDDNETPDIDVLFSTATFRVGHSAIPNRVKRIGRDDSDFSIPLTEAFFRPLQVLNNGGIDSLLKGAARECHERIDTRVIDGLRNGLFDDIPGVPGSMAMDLLTLNIARGRDHQLPSYLAARQYYGLSTPATFLELTGGDSCTADLLSALYGEDNIEACDPIICGLAEPATFGHMGPLFFSVNVDHFTRFRNADRFYFENSLEYGPGFTGEEVATIKATMMADILHRNTFLSDTPGDRNFEIQAFKTDACCMTDGNDVPAASTNVSLCALDGTTDPVELIVGDHCNALDISLNGDANVDAVFPGTAGLGCQCEIDDLCSRITEDLGAASCTLITDTNGVGFRLTASAGGALTWLGHSMDDNKNGDLGTNEARNLCILSLFGNQASTIDPLPNVNSFFVNSGPLGTGYWGSCETGDLNCDACPGDGASINGELLEPGFDWSLDAYRVNHTACGSTAVDTDAGTTELTCMFDTSEPSPPRPPLNLEVPSLSHVCLEHGDCASGVCSFDGPSAGGEPEQHFYCAEPESCDPFAPSRVDGVCNNIQIGRRLRGSAGELQLRRYDAGARVTDFGTQQIGERLISDRFASFNEDIPNPFGGSSLLIYFGQFIDHDLTLIHTNPSDARVVDGSGNVPPFVFSNSERFGVDREFPLLSNELTAYLDLTQVYGSDEHTANALRNGTDGLLISQLINDEELLPFNADFGTPLPMDMSMLPNIFAAGDVRANENIVLTSIHTLFLREHNRLARDIASNNPSMTDDDIYHEARKWNIAQYQNIVLEEWIPAIFGEALPEYVDYDDTETASIDVLFSTAAFRFGHSAIRDVVQLVESNGLVEHRQLGEAFFRPSLVLEGAGRVDSLLKGSARQCHDRIDPKVIDGLRSMLFEDIPGTNGSHAMDLFARNIARGRDHRLPTYTSARSVLGLSIPQTFDEVTGGRDCITEALNEIYGHNNVEDCDPIVCGFAEPPFRNGQLGELFHFVNVDQFMRIRDADRFYFENTHITGPGFTVGEVDEIKLVRLHDILRRNTFLNDLEGDENYIEDAFSTEACCTGSRFTQQLEQHLCTVSSTNSSVFDMPVPFESYCEAMTTVEQADGDVFFAGSTATDCSCNLGTTYPRCVNVKETLNGAQCTDSTLGGDTATHACFGIEAPDGDYLQWLGYTFDDNDQGSASVQTQNWCILALYGNKAPAIPRVPDISNSVFTINTAIQVGHWFDVDLDVLFEPGFDFNASAFEIHGPGHDNTDVDSAATSLTCCFEV